jgi:CheY-like chemotaxis protein
MDIRMPGMNGLEATRIIKANANGKPPVVIALTASALDEQRNAIMSGIDLVDDFLSKPCREDELLEKIRLHLNLEYRYTEEQIVPRDSLIAAGPVTGGELLAELPADWIDQLRVAVLSGEKERLDQLIQRVETRDVRAARTLQDFANRYEYDVLTRWFEEAAEMRTVERI